MNPTSVGVGFRDGAQFVCFKVERVRTHHFCSFDAGKITYMHQTVAFWLVPCRHDQCGKASGVFCERKRGGHHIHFSVAYQDVAVGPEAPKRLIFVDVVSVSVEEGRRADH